MFFRNFLPWFLIVLSSELSLTNSFKVGVGISDVTGPVAEIVFMGYAKSSQTGMGLHLRQYSRAFIIEDNNGNNLVFVSVDVGMIGPSIKKEVKWVLKRLSKSFGSLYNEQNVIISGTHTHSGPGGFLMHLLFDISILGFVRQTFDALVSGITQSIFKANNSKVEAKIYVNSGELLDANINRSPAAYLLNPEEERKQFKYNTDKDMTQLQFVSISTRKPLGVINWFAVHPTSMNNTNRLVSSDNVGYASILMEEFINGGLPGKGPFVAAFASSNLGDVSPNTKGPHCLNNGNPCDDVSSTCDGEAKICIATGPGKDMFESTRIIANKLFGKARELLNSKDSIEVEGPLLVGHRFVYMPNETAEFETANGTQTVRGCLPAMGYSFAAGTTDGPGEFDFKQATVTENRMWNAVRDLLATPTNDDKECHHPKPILLNTGRINFPYEWQPRIVSVQVALFGDSLALAAVPGEFTTMSGRRLRKAIADTFAKNGKVLKRAVIAGLCNVYTDYITTPEEYQLQRYEAASTIYGPHTLTIYLKLYKELTEALLRGNEVEPGPQPIDFSKKLISLNLPVIFDSPGLSSNYGDCVHQPPDLIKRGDVVRAVFVAGNPRNNLMHGKTFLTIEKLNREVWEVVATDSSWDTKFIWHKSSKISPSSEAIIEWTTEPTTPTGTYRIRHMGYYKYIFGGIFPYQGLSHNFQIV